MTWGFMVDRDGKVLTEADRIADDVQANHLDHMMECARCTWWYCDHYSCDCHESCVGKHRTDGSPIDLYVIIDSLMAAGLARYGAAVVPCSAGAVDYTELRR